MQILVFHLVTRLTKNYCRAIGGREAEKVERERWIQKEQQKITDSVNGRRFKILIQNIN